MVKGHVIENRWGECALGFVALVIGAYLVWDAFDNRGHKLPWPLSGLAFW
jgi:hypothetical protein